MEDASHPVIELVDVYKRLGGRMPLNGASATFHAGEIYVVTGGTAAIRTTVARMLAGQSPVDGGRIHRRGMAAPLVGGAMGFNMGGSVLRGLELRAAAYDIDRRDYIDQVAALLDNPEALRRGFRDLNPIDKALVQYGSTYLLPCSLYISDGSPLPGLPPAQQKLTTLAEQARERAAMICFGRKPTMASGLGERRLVRLTKGQLKILDRTAPTTEEKRKRRQARRKARKDNTETAA